MQLWIIFHIPGAAKYFLGLNAFKAWPTLCKLQLKTTGILPAGSRGIYLYPSGGLRPWSILLCGFHSVHSMQHTEGAGKLL